MLLQGIFQQCGIQPKTYEALRAQGQAAWGDYEPCNNNGDCQNCPLKNGGYQSRAALPSHGDSVYVREGWDGFPYSMNRLSQGWRSTAYWGYGWKDLVLHPDWKPVEFGFDSDSRWVLMRRKVDLVDV